MNKLDIEIISNLNESLWYKYEMEDPNIKGETWKDRGLREPFRSKSLETLMTLKDRFSGVALTDYGINSYDWDDNRTKIILYEFNNPDKYDLIAELIDDLFSVSTLVESIDINLNTSVGDSFYQGFLPKLYNESKGRIPLHKLLKTQFKFATQSTLNFIKEKLINSLNEKGIQLAQEQKNIDIVTVINPK